MMGKTHIAIGIASALLVVQPHTHSELASTLIGGAIGGVMSDIDMKINRSNRFAQKASMDAIYGELSAVVIAMAALVSDYLRGGTIISSIIGSWRLALAGLVAFCVLTIIGKTHSKHRDRTHSLLACLLFTLSVFFIHRKIGIAFGLGYFSHLMIDLMNKSPERLFYPFKKGICFKVCYADRFGNELLFSAGTAFCVFYMLSLMF